MSLFPFTPPGQGLGTEPGEPQHERGVMWGGHRPRVGRHLSPSPSRKPCPFPSGPVSPFQGCAPASEGRCSVHRTHVTQGPRATERTVVTSALSSSVGECLLMKSNKLATGDLGQKGRIQGLHSDGWSVQCKQLSLQCCGARSTFTRAFLKIQSVRTTVGLLGALTLSLDLVGLITKSHNPINL